MNNTREEAVLCVSVYHCHTLHRLASQRRFETFLDALFLLFTRM
jgi:hypothetical protein